MRRKNAVPSYLLHQRSGQARVRINGREIFLGKFDSPESKAKYAAIIGGDASADQSALQLPAKRPAISSSASVSLAECMVRYLEHAATWPKADNRTSAEYRHFRVIFRLFEEHFADLVIDELRGPQIKRLLSAMVERDWARKYANAQLRRIRRFVKWCVSEDLCGPDVLARVAAVDALKAGRTDARETEPIGPVDDVTFEATLKCLPPVVADLCRVIRLNGARPGEIRRLRIRDIDCTREVWEARLRRHKNLHRGKVRTLHFGPRAQAILAKYLNRPADDFVFSPKMSEQLRLAAMRERRKTKVQPSQVSRAGKKRLERMCPYYTDTALCRAVRRACIVALKMPEELRTIPKTLEPQERSRRLSDAVAWRREHVWHPNQLRHSSATEIRAKYDAESASVVLGHSSLNTTEIYAEKNLAKARGIMAEIG